jgi:hypothetical protein
MILNAYAVLAGFLSMLRLLLALVSIGVAFTLWRKRRSSPGREEADAIENRAYLLSFLGLTVTAIAALSWPLLYVLLQSYVPQWPGVMCVYGVTQIGVGSVGSSRFLPSLLLALQVIKPFMVFLAGSWLVLDAINRSARSAPLLGRLIALQVVLALVATADAGLELSYLAIPKKEEFLSSGCCTEAPRRAASLEAYALSDPADADPRFWLRVGYFAANGALIGMLYQLLRCLPSGFPAERRVMVLLGAAGTGVVTYFFLREVAAPAILHLPYHRCLYDLLSGSPLTVVAMACHLLAGFAVGWAGVAATWGRSAESNPALTPVVSRCLFLALNGYLASLAIVATQWSLVQP